jgi:hypothetical protein
MHERFDTTQDKSTEIVGYLDLLLVVVKGIVDPGVVECPPLLVRQHCRKQTLRTLTHARTTKKHTEVRFEEAACRSEKRRAS